MDKNENQRYSESVDVYNTLNIYADAILMLQKEMDVHREHIKSIRNVNILLSIGLLLASISGFLGG